eukprot:jgi/Galph1/5725/GphlegSOOS_G4304.1
MEKVTFLQHEFGCNPLEGLEGSPTDIRTSLNLVKPPVGDSEGALRRLLSPESLVDLLQEECLVVDVRSTPLYEVGHISGSRSLPVKKRKLQKSQSLSTYLHKWTQKLALLAAEWKKNRTYCAVILYDHSSTEETLWNPIWVVYEQCQRKQLVDVLFVLRGGFLQFSHLYPKHTSCRLVQSPRKKCYHYFNCELSTTLFQETSPSRILPFLYLGNDRNASDKDVLDSLQITHILIVGEELAPHFPEHYCYKQLMIKDLETQVLYPFLEEAIEFIESGRVRGKVFVHCYAGVSRSAAVVLAYFIYRGNTLQEAWDFLVSQKKDIQPLASFIVQLSHYEKGCKRSSLFTVSCNDDCI